MSNIRFHNVRKVFDGDVVALEEFSLDIPSPTLVVLVGPSGCGKTTLLRLIAGLERPTSGTIHLGDSRLDTLDARRRDVAMVFQNYALYPHMTVRENMSFGLRIRKVPRATIEAKVIEVARSLEIDHLLDRRPGQLSGGQRQRVALGRAIVREPKAFLFDEPLSNLDARLRDEMRYLIKRLYQRLRTTTVYVTHDQVEAMTIGEMLVVLKDGKIHQVGSPGECYRLPADAFVASFLGSPPMNLIRGAVEPDEGVARFTKGDTCTLPGPVGAALADRGEKEVLVGVRPEDVRLDDHDTTSAGLRLRGSIVLSEPLGHEVLTHIAYGDKEIVVRGREIDPAGPAVDVAFRADAEALHFFYGSDAKRIATESPAPNPMEGRI